MATCNVVIPPEITLAPSVAETIAAAAVGVVAFYLADKYEEIAEDALEKQDELANRVFAIQEWIGNHWKSNQYAQQMSGLSTIYGLTAPVASPSAILDTINATVNKTAAGAKRGLLNTYDRYRLTCGKRDCITDIDLTAPIASVNASHHLLKHAERRYYRMDDGIREYASAAYHGSRQQPDAIFTLLSHAQGTYANIANSAIQSADGLASLAGKSIGTFIGGVFG